MTALRKYDLNPEPKMRVLLIDDHESFLNALGAMLKQARGIEVVGCANGGIEGLELAAVFHPDLVVVDFAMPDMDGVSVTQKLKAGANPPKVVMMSFHAEPEYRDMAIHAGADAFITKTDLHKELVPLLERFDDQAG